MTGLYVMLCLVHDKSNYSVMFSVTGMIVLI